MALVTIEWRPDATALRKFGLVVIIGLCIIGAVFQFVFENQVAAFWIYIAAGVIGLPALSGTAIALPGYWLWMGVAFVMGNITGRVLLALLFYLMITPMGIIRRMINDKLQRRAANEASYWVELPADDIARSERQF